MPRFLPLSFGRSFAAPLAALAFAALLAPGAARAQSDQQQLVDRSTLAVQDLMSGSESALGMLRKARAVMICPRVFRAGFFFGGEGGGCVLAARDASGSWSYPAFYNMGSGSFGLQIGIQDMQFVMMIMTQKGLDAVMDDQFKLGGDATIAVATFGGGVQGATTGNFGADIVAYTMARGLYGGVTVQGSMMTTDTKDNQAYYGQPLAARQIVVQMQGTNQGADPLREVLTRFGSGAAPTEAASAAPVPGAAPMGAPAQATGRQPTQLTPSAGVGGTVQQQSLPPPKG
ncbi:MAG: lipid-binding SYLF domain-containing protein [Proteobacteria bacterium]|nr:lipid-binding SYLF domain-containing protein [Pseudomonadota bacterium]